VTACQQFSSIIGNQAELMPVPETVPDNRVLSLATKIGLALLQLIAVCSSGGSESSSGQLTQSRYR
jgi:hypothetical protein